MVTFFVKIKSCQGGIKKELSRIKWLHIYWPLRKCHYTEDQEKILLYNGRSPPISHQLIALNINGVVYLAIPAISVLFTAPGCRYLKIRTAKTVITMLKILALITESNTPLSLYFNIHTNTTLNNTSNKQLTIADQEYIFTYPNPHKTCCK